MSEQHLFTSQAAALLHISPSKLKRLADQGVFTVPRLGGMLSFPVPRLEEIRAAIEPFRRDLRHRACVG